MLKTRIITALVLLAIVLPALFAPSALPFTLLAGVFVTAGVWEWGRLNGLGQAAALFMAAVVGMVLMLAWGLQLTALPGWVWWLASVVWVLGGAWLLRQGVAGWGRLPQALRLVLGCVMLALVWVVLGLQRSIGNNSLLSIFFLVWAADVFAYFGGKTFGRRKLAPSISPGKSWEGAFTGALGVLLVAAVWVAVDARIQPEAPSLYTVLYQRYDLWAALPLLGLSAMSVVGDLVESLVKRSADMKDSSQLLPGHGGVLDRVDALLPVLPLTMCFLG
ncbi:phosphatidate cytidylyltransferase [Hydrogenophaga soli]